MWIFVGVILLQYSCVCVTLSVIDACDIYYWIIYLFSLLLSVFSGRPDVCMCDEISSQVEIISVYLSFVRVTYCDSVLFCRTTMLLRFVV